MDYIYKNSDGTKRIKIFRRDPDHGTPAGWDFDVWSKVDGNCVEVGEGWFTTKKAAKADAEAAFGKLKSIQVETVDGSLP